MRNMPHIMLINRDAYSPIIHRYGPGSSRQMILSDGLVEASHTFSPWKTTGTVNLTMPELQTDARHLLRRKLSFAIPALVFLVLAAVEPIEMGFFAETLASLSAEASMTQDAVVYGPAHCIVPSDSDAAREPLQINI
jgi:hypothetical protein